MTRSTIFENKTTMAEAAGEKPCRTDMTSEEARNYQKAALPGERRSPMDVQHPERPRRGHGY